MAFTPQPYVEISETYSDLLTRLEARDAEVDKLNHENIVLNKRVAALEKIIGKNYSSTQQDGDGSNPCSSASVVNPIFEGDSDTAVNNEHSQMHNMRGRSYFE